MHPHDRRHVSKVHLSLCLCVFSHFSFGSLITAYWSLGWSNSWVACSFGSFISAYWSLGWSNPGDAVSFYTFNAALWSLCWFNSKDSNFKILKLISMENMFVWMTNITATGDDILSVRLIRKDSEKLALIKNCQYWVKNITLVFRVV